MRSVEWYLFSYPLHSTLSLGGFPSEYRHPVRYGKKFEDIFIRFDATHERDRQTD